MPTENEHVQALRIDWSRPGAPLSAAAHAALLVAILVGFTASPLPDATEAIPVETITDAQFNQIMKGEKSAKPLPTPQLKVDKVAPVEARKPAPPTPQAKLDVPAAPPKFKPADDPGDDTKLEPAPAPAKAAVAPPEPTPVPKPVTQPTLQRSEPKPQQAARQSAPEAKQLPTPDKPDAEVIEKAKQPKPKKESAAEPTHPPSTRPAEHKPAAKALQDSKVKPDKALKDQVAKLLDEKKLEELAAEPAPKPVEKPKKRRKLKSGQVTEGALASARDFLNKDAPQSTGSTGRKLTQVASLGALEANAPRLSPFFMGQLGVLIESQYRRCWNNQGLEDTDYVPRFDVRFNPDWSLAAKPVLLNKPGSAKEAALAASAMKAFLNPECSPLKIPDSYSRYYDQWKHRAINFDPKPGGGGTG